MKYKINKLIISALIFLVGLWVNIYFSTNVHYLLTHKINVLSLIKIEECLESIAISKEHLQLFLCLQGFISLVSIYYYVANHKPYQSELIEITPQISTPVSAGQKQFGSASWLSKKERDTAFKSYILNPNDRRIKKLVKLSETELKSVKNKKEEGFNSREKQKGRSINNAKSKTKIKKIQKTYTIKSHSKSNNNKSESHSTKEKNKKDYQLQMIKSGGMVIGKETIGTKEKIYYIDDDTHTLCIGATRSGKTRSLVVQTIGTLGLAGESMILSDPKAELYNYTYSYLESLGYEVICLDFKNPLKSDRYNFLQPVIDAVDNDDIPHAVEATWDLTASLVPENSHNEKIWTNGEASIIAAAIIAVVYDNKVGADRRFQNMSNVYFFISEMCKTVDKTMPLIKYMKHIGLDHPARALLSISEVAPSKTRGSFYTSALITLRLFTNPLIHSMTSISDFDLNTTGENKRAIYIIIPDEKTTYYSLASLFVNQTYMALVKNADNRGGRLKRRVNYILDEFGNFVKIPDFANKLTVGGGRGIRFNLFLQSFMQLDEKYGRESAGTIKSNCETWIYLQADDLSTLEEISKKLGNYTVSTYSLSSSHGKFTRPSSSHSINLTHRQLLTVDEIRLISRPYILVTSRNNPAVMSSPDLSKWAFNRIFGLGDKEYNRMVRERRENMRKSRTVSGKIDTWNIWEYFIEEGRSEQTRGGKSMYRIYENAGEKTDDSFGGESNED